MANEQEAAERRTTASKREPDDGSRAGIKKKAPLTSAEVRAKHKEFLFPSCANYYKEPVALETSKGSRLTDLDGKTYLDFFGGILTVSLGRAHERVNAALHAQIDRLGHVSTLYPHVPIVELAEKLVSLAPG